jgi:hypothetical protein
VGSIGERPVVTSPQADRTEREQEPGYAALREYVEWAGENSTYAWALRTLDAARDAQKAAERERDALREAALEVVAVWDTPERWVGAAEIKLRAALGGPG